ncbi:uncharacterized protein LOC111403651 isoform X1 [Olea europaea var. sylvestris]|uniref:uncharacterized protein LOC111403651 isoform X1 n=1 Tax=Olea europaea var. sylvestris TaxID=158386 RepID=UPI000C1D7BF9|nr:uncharacterized protein LOC111403651 isoform X1 [Olea europaea var. sylvestris]
MATTVLKAPPTFGTTNGSNSTLTSRNFTRVSFISIGQKCSVKRCRNFHSSITSIKSPHRSLKKFLNFASDGEAVETQTETLEKDPAQEAEPDIEGSSDGGGGVDAASESDSAVAEESASAVKVSLNLYKEALANNDEVKVAEIELFLKSIEDEKIDLGRKVATLSEELSYEKARILRISADFDNFRKRTERERLNLVTNAQGEVVETLLSVLDNFERAKSQIKVEKEGEEKIHNSYQSIYKQFVEILGSLGVVPVETVGKPFDPMLHEAIMREDSTEFEDGIILEEYRKGFKLGERLLRPSMVKVSSGPGPAKSKTAEPSEEAEVKESSEEGSPEAASAEE